jgi:hypothetical protein
MEYIMKSRFAKKPQGRAGRLAAAALMLAGALLAQTAFASAAGAAKMAKPFTWSAELVSFDPASRMLTVKSLIDKDVDITKLHDFEKGQAVTLWWTGLTQGSSIRNITDGRAASAPADALVLPVRFVGTEMNDQYVVYRLRVPPQSVPGIKALEPGDWVTAASPRHAAGPGKAVTAIHGYNDIG